jgi:proteic killer suppression protein
LAFLHSAGALHDLKSPGLHLEALKGGRAGQHGIRINDQFRILLRVAGRQSHQR